MEAPEHPDVVLDNDGAASVDDMTASLWTIVRERERQFS